MCKSASVQPLALGVYKTADEHAMSSVFCEKIAIYSVYICMQHTRWCVLLGLFGVKSVDKLCIACGYPLG